MTIDRCVRQLDLFRYRSASGRVSFFLTVALGLGVAGLLGCAPPEAQEPSAVEPAAATGPESGVTGARLLAADDEPGSWLTHGRNYSEQRHSPLTQIDESNVSRLGLAWSYDTGRTRGHEATPIVADGQMFVTTPWSGVHALDAMTGELLWIYDPDVPGEWGRYACCDVVNRGVAISREHVFLGTLDGRLVKLEAATGEVAWEVLTVDRERPYTITGAPRVIGKRVIIGNGGAEYGVRGYVSAYDSEDGELLWRFYTVPGNPADGFENAAMERAASTWKGEWWVVGGGGTVWDGMAYDPDLDLLYVGTGNGTPWARAWRSPGGGDNLYLSSILALSPSDGSLVWHYQTTPGDNWDYTATQNIILADLEISGKLRRVLMQAPKNGFFYVIDRETGELLSAEKFGYLTWASHVDMATGRPVELPGGNYDEEPRLIFPSPGGAHNWQPMAFSPQTGLVYIPMHRRGSVYGLAKDFEYTPGAWNLGTARDEASRAAFEVPEAQGFLQAWDPVAGREAWRVEQPSRSNGGLLSTAGNLIFQGTADGKFSAYRASDGEKLWESSPNVGIIAPPIAWQADEIQHITVVAGWGGVGGGAKAIAKTHLNPGRVLTYRLDGTAEMPVVERKADAAGPLPEPFGSPEQIATGEVLYSEFCAVCHGGALESNGLISDLRYSRRAVFDNFEEIVLDGRFEARGMASFADVLSPEDTQAVRAYVIDRAQSRP